MLVVAICVAYLLGSLSPGWWLVRRITGVDLRASGSGATGATNAGRILGRRAFVAVMVLDAAKAALAVFLGQRLVGVDSWATLTLPAAVAGHIWPITLGFRGGRGAAPLLGGCVALNPWFALVAAAGAAVASIVTRKTIVLTVAAAVAGIGAFPWLVPNLPGRVSFGLALALVVLAHRSHFVRAFRRPPSETSRVAHGNCDHVQDRDLG